ncbi:MAG: putative peptidoglycan lipid flippase [Thermodesulfobacteriota bacterium]|nr:putative peptidoglycan lipid flippase [Thermodesulfobacteriota bacterium]
MPEKRLQSQGVLPGTESPMVTERKAITRAAGVVGFWTVLSRVLGFVRDMVIARFMGAGLGADAFFVAFRIPNLLRRLFAEGALSAAFIPTYVETLQRHGRDEAGKLARRIFTLSAIILLVVTLLGILACPWIVRVIAPGFFQDPEKFDLTVCLTRIMFPYIFFISLVALASGVLNSMGHFAAPAAAPVILNICMIGSVLFTTTSLNTSPSHALAWGVVIAGFLQLLLQFPFLRREDISFKPSFDFNNPALIRIGKLFVPAALGGAVYQVNVMIGTILASLLQPGGVSWLYYADRLVELPLGIFAIALGTAVLPSMSRLADSGDMRGLTQSVAFSLRLIGFFTIPASVGLIVLREPVVATLFQRGKFTFIDTQATAYALLWYTVGLWAFSGLKVVTQAFFSLKDTRTPVKVSLLAVVTNLAGGLILMVPMEQGGLALATSLAAALNVAILFIILVRRLGTFPSKDFVLSLIRISAASAVMSIPLFYGRALGEWNTGSNVQNLLVLSGCISAGLFTFALVSVLLGSPEVKALRKLLSTQSRE